MAGEEGFEPSNAGIKIRCLNQLGDSPAAVRLVCLTNEARIVQGNFSKNQPSIAQLFSHGHLTRKLVYNAAMPAPSIVSALISSVINAVVDSSLSPSDQVLQESALVRPFPAEAKRGEMQPPQQGEVVIGGRTLYLSPGAQIRNADNRIIMPSAVQEAATVRYLTDASGAVFRVWMLTPEEASAPESQNPP